MVTAILAAAGQGRRFGAGENKIFAPLGGRTVLHWSLGSAAACPEVDAVVVVTAPGDLPLVREIVSGVAKVRAVCPGGAERSDSVWNALQSVPPGTELVAIHDAARPLARPELFSELVRAARRTGAAVPALPVSDTVKRSPDGRSTGETVDRRELFAVQTPQVFEYGLLLDAYRQAGPLGFRGTDDASYVERLGRPITLVPGPRDNLKITVAEDLIMAEKLLPHPAGALRSGIGYDVHRLVPGRRLVLGGVELRHPDGLGLEGHSDADVLVHAVADALLGAAALGDIGAHFPNDDPHYRNADSLVLLEIVGRRVREAGWEINGVDATVIAERPKLRPHVPEMRARISGALGIHEDQVSVKATTNEGLGFEGREEGISAHAAAALRGGPPVR